MKYLSAILVAALLSGPAAAQNTRFDRAEKLFERYAFHSAIDVYKDVVSKDAAHKQAMLRLGDCYRLLNDYEQAARWYGDAGISAEVPTEYRLFYGMALQASGRCDEAIEHFQAYADHMPGDSRGTELTAACADVGAFHGDEDLFRIGHAEGLNSPASDFGPAFHGEAIVFASARGEGSFIKRRHAWTGQPFLDLWVAESGDEGFEEPNRFSARLNGRFHEGPLSFDPDGTVYFTRNPAGKDEGDSRKLQVFRANVTETDAWEEATVVDLGAPEFSNAHPTISADGNQMIFASDRPDGFGGSDLWMSTRDAEGWSDPVNLGPEVNTEGEEVFPFLHADGTLYFSSDGHAGLGGLDQFSAEIRDTRGRRVRNMGYPLNTNADDFGLIWDEHRERGFFASNREGGLGSDDIYTMAKIVVLLSGEIFDEKTGDLLTNAVIRLDDGTYEKNAEAMDDGTFEFEVGPNRKLRVEASVEGYETASVELATKEGEQDYTIRVPMRRLTAFDGSVVDIEGHPVADVEVSLFDATGELVERIRTDEEGLFAFSGVVNGPYEVEASKVGFTGLRMPADPMGLRFTLRPECTFANVYFDYGEEGLRTDARHALGEVLAALKADPDLRLEVHSHTDARSSHRFNDALSERRTGAVVEWLIGQGVEIDRLVPLASGKRKPASDCGDDAACLEREHQNNRRTEFRCL